MTRKLLLLISQSAEMDEAVTRNRMVGQPLTDIRTCAEHIETTTNAFLGKLSEGASVDVGVLTYMLGDEGVELKSVLSDGIENCYVNSSNLNDLPHEVETRYRKVANGTGGIDEVEFEFKTWYSASEGEQVSPFEGLEAALQQTTELSEPVLIVHLHTMVSGELVLKSLNKSLDIPSHVDVLNFCITTSELVPSVVLPVDDSFPTDPDSNFVKTYSGSLSTAFLKSLEENGLSSKEGAKGAILNGKLIEMAKVMKAVSSFLAAHEDELDVDTTSGEAIAEVGNESGELGDDNQVSEGIEDPRWRPVSDDPVDVVDETDESAEDEDVELLLDDEDADPPSLSSSDEIDVLIVFDPSGSLDDPKRFSKCKTAFGLILEKLARRDGEQRIAIAEIGNSTPKLTTLAELKDPSAENIEEYEEEVAAGGGGIMTIPHVIPWVYQPSELMEVDTSEQASFWNESLNLSQTSEVILVLSDSTAAQTFVSSIKEQLDSLGGRSLAVWLYINDASMTMELPINDELPQGMLLLNELVDHISVEQDGAYKVVINGRASKLC